MFSKTNLEKEETEEETAGFREKDELEMLQILMNYDSEDVRSAVMPWAKDSRDQKPGRSEPKEKTRFTFFIKDQEKAVKCFKDF